VEIGYAGPGEVEAFTVEYDRSGAPARALMAALTPQGSRCWTASAESAVVAGLLAGDLLGATFDVQA